MTYTKLTNSFIDDVMPTISATSTVVFLAMLRRTVGWQKESDTISLSQLVRATGLSRPTVIKAISELRNQKLIAVSHQRADLVSESNMYTILCTSQESLLPSQESLLPSQNNLPDVVKEFDHQVVKKIDTQKKGYKEKKESSEKRDSRLDAWQLQTYRELARLHVPILFRNQVIETVSDPDLWQLVITTWIGRGYRPNAIGPMLDWYQKGIPNAKRQRPEQSSLRSDDGRRASEHVASPEEYIAKHSNNE